MPAQGTMNKSAKGNPAHKRMSNKHRQEYRASLRVRQEKRKELRRQEQDKRHAENVKRVSDGFPTAWEIAKQNRRDSEARTAKRREFYRISRW